MQKPKKDITIIKVIIFGLVVALCLLASILGIGFYFSPMDIP